MRFKLTATAACAALVGFALWHAPLRAQDDLIFKSQTSLVTLYVSITDKAGKLVTDLPQSAFKVYENDAEQHIQTFAREDVPVSIGIIIDSSGSMAPKIKQVAAAALALVKASNPMDEVFIVNFNDDLKLTQPFTSDVHQLEEALGQIDHHGGTAMRNALLASIDYVKDKGTRDKKVLVVVTDGNDNGSTETKLETLIREAQRSEVLIYSIGLLNDESARDRKEATSALNQLAEASGGFAYFPKDLGEVEKITPEIAHEIRNQYVLAYTPHNAALDGTFRKIRVDVKGLPRNVSVRYRSGYYASPASKAIPPVTLGKE